MFNGDEQLMETYKCDKCGKKLELLDKRNQFSVSYKVLKVRTFTKWGCPSGCILENIYKDSTRNQREE